MPESMIVSDRDSLLAALANASGGETIFLQGGEYGDLTLVHNARNSFRFDETVRLVGLDPEDPPVVTRLRVENASNLSFEGFVFDYRYQLGNNLEARPFRIWDSEDITISHSLFSGDTVSGTGGPSDGFPNGRGLNIRNSTSVEILESEFEGFHRGLVVQRSEDVLLWGNSIHGIRSDGINVTSTKGITIENNHLHNFVRALGSGDHSDMIQIHTRKTPYPSSDIVIRGNYLDSGAGHYTQSIFMGNEEARLGGGEEWFYRNVLIEDNVIINTQLHGITLGESIGAVIRNNSVLRVETADETMRFEIGTIPRINIAKESIDIEVTGNVTSAIRGFENQPSWLVDGNIFVQNTDMTAPGWYGDMFVSSSLQIDGSHHNYLVMPGSVIDLQGAGASALRQPVTQAVFNFDSAQPNGREVVFDATPFVDAHLPGTSYHWDFGDGTMATGPLVSHSYTYAGSYPVMLTVTCPQNGVSIAQNMINVQGVQYLSLSGNGMVQVDRFGETTLVEIENSDEKGHLVLGAAGVSGRVERALLQPLLQEESVALHFTLMADTPGNTGEILRVHQVLGASVNQAGEVVVSARTAENDHVRLVSQGLQVNDGAAHAVEMRLSDGILSLWVNDVQVDAQAFSGTIRDHGRHDLTFGTPWHGADRFFDGVLTEFGIRMPHGAEIRASGESEETPVFAAFEEIEAALEDVADTRIILTTHETVQLGGDGVASRIDRSELAALFSEDDIAISFTLDAGHEGAAGEVFRLHGICRLLVNSRGEVEMHATAENGERVHLISRGVQVNDGAAHQVEIQLSAGQLSLWINEMQVDDVELAGGFRNSGRHDLTFGNPWHGADRFFAGELSGFQIDLGITDTFSALTSVQAGFADQPMV